MIDVGGVRVLIQLDNGQLATGLIESEQLLKKGGVAMEGHATKTATKVKNAFSRMFGIGALIGTGLMLARSFYGAIEAGVGRAIKSNDELSGRMNKLKASLDSMFTSIGIALLPIVNKVVGMLEMLAKFSNQGYQKRIDTNNADIANMSKPLAALEARKGGPLSFLDAPSINMLKDRIQYLTNQNKTIKEQIILLDTVNTKEEKTSTTTKDKAKTTLEAIEASVTGVKELSEEMLQLSGIEDQVAAKFKEIGNFAADVGKKFAEAGGDIAKISQGGIVTMAIAGFTLLFTTLKSIIDSVMAGAKGVDGAFDHYSSTLTKLNAQLEKMNALLGLEETIRNKTAEDIEREIKANKDNMKVVQDQMDNTEEFIATRKEQVATWQKIYDATPDYITNQKEVIGNSLAGLKTDLQNAETELTGYQTQMEGYKNNIEDLETEKTELMKEQAEAAQAVAKALQDQTKEILRQKGELGYYDYENYGRQIQAIAELQATGLQGLDLAKAASDIGINNESIGQIINVGSVQIAAYGATGESVADAFINTQTGE